MLIDMTSVFNFLLHMYLTNTWKHCVSFLRGFRDYFRILPSKGDHFCSGNSCAKRLELDGHPSYRNIGPNQLNPDSSTDENALASFIKSFLVFLPVIFFITKPFDLLIDLLLCPNFNNSHQLQPHPLRWNGLSEWWYFDMISYSKLYDDYELHCINHVSGPPLQ